MATPTSDQCWACRETSGRSPSSWSRPTTRIPVLVNAVMDFDADGRAKVIRAAIFDATERRAYERELLRAKETAEAAEQRAVASATVPTVGGVKPSSANDNLTPYDPRPC